MSLITETKSRKIDPDITIVEISGRLNLGNSLVSIETSIKKLIEEGARKLVIDLANVNYIDSSGIGMLVSCAGQIMHQGGAMRIGGAQGTVAKAFRIVHMDRITPLDETAEAACGHFQADGAAM